MDNPQWILLGFNLTFKWCGVPVTGCHRTNFDVERLQDSFDQKLIQNRSRLPIVSRQSLAAKQSKIHIMDHMRSRLSRQTTTKALRDTLPLTAKKNSSLSRKFFSGPMGEKVWRKREMQKDSLFHKTFPHDAPVAVIGVHIMYRGE